MTGSIDDRDVKIVIVCGKYFVWDAQRNMPDYAAIDRNIFLARQVQRMCFQLPNDNVFVFCPHQNTAHFEFLTTVAEPQYQAGDRAVIRRMGDAGIVVPNWTDSSGTKMEIELFNELGRPVFRETESLSAWIGGLPDFKFEVERVELEGRSFLFWKLKDLTRGPLTMQEVNDYTL
ncbi:hypothetical protein AMJ57_00570 [Parcubacteria bacterium SG8_24]|nr:MAG: hypothetical protein AMJ57_00570 [Parcubacteria bacterium SG8_24]